MRCNMVGPFIVNAPFGTEIAFAKGLRRIGVDVVEVDPNVDRGLDGLDRDADATIVFKNCVGSEGYLETLKNPVIVYQPDDARFPHIREMMLRMRPWSDLFLSFDGHGADVARTMGYRAAETLLLTADDELYCPSPVPIERDIDVSFIGSMGDYVAHSSRRKMVELVSQEADRRGWRTWFGTTQHIPTIVDVYRRSKVVLNHATDVGQGFGWGYGLQCRHFEVAMTRTRLLSNYSHDEAPVVTLCSMFCDETTLIERVTELVDGTRDYETLADMSYDSVKREHMPEHRATQLVDFIGRYV